jgi:tetratricopeptide (TPR) repeat protein
VALAKEDYARAVEYLEEVLALNPKASSVHSPLAMAYRGLGQRDRAAAHLEQWSNTDILVPDPLRNELDLLLQSGLSYELRGIRAFEAGDWNAAAGFFRQGLALTSGDVPLSRSLRHKLGTALFLSGDAPGALTQFEEVVRLAPASGLDEAASKAYYSIGVLMASSGRIDEAIEHFSGAVRYQPNYPEAHLGLADVLRRAGRVRESLSHYERVLALNPQTAEAEFGYTMGLVRLQRHREARERLISAMRNHPDRPQFAQALARLLAASPDDEVRDGERAMMLVQQLLQQGRNLDLGETLAMTLAELGDFVSAEATLRDVIASAERVGMTDAVRRMAVNLDLYENRRPCRTPWQDDDPVHLPGPPVDPSLIAALTASPGG